MPYLWLWALCLLSGQVLCNSLLDSQVDNYVNIFQKTLDNHLEEKLALTKIRNIIRSHERELGIRKINGSLEFQRIFLSIQLRFADLQQSVGHLKSAIENHLNGPSVSHLGPGVGSVSTPMQAGPAPPPIPGRTNQNQGSSGPAAPGPPPVSGNNIPPQMPGSGPPIPLGQCCGNSGPFVYDGRFREKVALKECYENVNSQLKAVRRNSGIIAKMKENLQADSSVRYQYYMSKAGHYIQYPVNNRTCDKQSPLLSSPLTEEWFVEKLYMERKNLVILMDNGQATQTRVSPASPQTHKNLMSEAVRLTLNTLTSNDKVNIVMFPHGSQTTGVTADCDQNLLVATQSNVNLLADFVQSAPFSNTEPNLMEGLTKVYTLLEQDQAENQASFQRRTNLVIMLIDGKSNPTDLAGTALFEMIARYQQKLGNNIEHMVYIIGEPATTDFEMRMAQIADQNNLKISLSSRGLVEKWPAIPGLVDDGKPVGKEGVLTEVKDIQSFPDKVSTYFQTLPPKLDNSKSITTLTPILDNLSGIKMSLAALVYNHSEVHGVVAVDSSIATVFAEIVNFDVGHDSYMFLLDLNHGHVLIHPKLRDPDETVFDDTIFPRLEIIEPELTVQERTKILNATASLEYFQTSQLNRVRTLVSGEITGHLSVRPLHATVYYQRLHGTYLCLILVHFSSDAEEARLQVVTGTQSQQLHAPYHRIDKTVVAPFPNKPNKADVCHLYEKFVSFKESVIKLSPSVFAEPEVYKYKVESVNDISEINSFLIHGGNTTLIRKDARDLIQQTVRATNQLDTLWQQGVKDVIDRFYGATSGVFRLFPGMPLPNNYDHMKTDWFQRSIAFPDTTFYHYTKLTSFARNKVVIVSRAVTEQGRLQGVVGLTVTARYLMSQLLNSVSGCYGKDVQCHIIDASGYILDYDDTKSNDKIKHLSQQYPWLVAELQSVGAIETDRCTSFSDGYHKLLYTLAQNISLDTSGPDRCWHYRLEPVTHTNLFLLILEDRQKHNCVDSTQSCLSCSVTLFNPRYQLNMGQCQMCDDNNTVCQCPCFCVTDLNICQGQFKTQEDNLPFTSCYNSPVIVTQAELQPDSPGPMFEHCSIPCASIEDLSICNQLNHCKPSSDVFQVCVWKDEKELVNITESKFLPTTPIPTPPPLKTTKSTITSVPFPKPQTVLSTKASNQDITTKPGLPVQTMPAISTISSRLSTIASASPATVSKLTSTPNTSRLVPILTSKLNTSRLVPSLTKLTTPQGLVHGTSKTLESSLMSTVTIAASRLQTDGQGSPGATVRSLSSNQAGLGSTISLTSHPEDSGHRLSGGQIAAIVIGILAVVALTTIILIKVYGKKFRRPGAADSSKYLASSSLFNSSFFNKSAEEVTLSTAPSSTVTYQEIPD